MGEETSPAFPFYAKDWLVDTAHMTHEEKGVYIDALCHAWVDAGLPDDRTRLQKIFSLSAHKMKKIWPTIAEKFASKGGKLFNGRMERERARQAENRRRRAEAGKKGASARWADADSNANGDRNANANADAMAKNGLSTSTALEEKEDPTTDLSFSEPSTGSGVDW